jgi:hydroxyacylglutathione hydrolase
MAAIQPIPAFSDNYIWLLPDTPGVHVVDPGDAAPVLKALEKQALTLTSILITHHHFDHIGGLEQLKAQTGCTVYGPDNPAIEGIDHILADGDEISIGSYHFRIIAVPGHTLDHIAYYQPPRGGEAPLLFCGDTLFAAGCGRIFEGNPAMMHASLQRLAALPGDCAVFCAHEYTLANLRFARAADPDNSALREREAAAEKTRQQGQPTVPSTIALELDTNPFLRAGKPGPQAALREDKAAATDDEVATFAALRSWKDNF